MWFFQKLWNLTKNWQKYWQCTTKIAIKILQGSAVTKNMSGGLIAYHLLLQIFCSVCMPKITKICWHTSKLWAKLCAFLWHHVKDRTYNHYNKSFHHIIFTRQDSNAFKVRQDLYDPFIANLMITTTTTTTTNFICQKET